MSARMQQETNLNPELDQLCINTIRTLTLDAVQKAKSGHPGLPLGAAPMAYVLWTRFMHYNPRNPKWENRDRFLLSAGHGCMLLYSLLHLTGYDLSLDEIKNFRQWESKTPRHPENVLTPGVEITTGPLGQGFANGVGMAMAEAHLAAKFNQKEFSVIDHYVYAIVSDGDLMEGVASEAASLAGHLKLGKLIYFYDDNHVTIEGFTSLAFSEDVPKRFEAYGWHTQTVEDGNDLDRIESAIREARDDERPSLISVKTTIGFGMPTAGTRKAHSDAPGEEAVKETKRALGWPEDKQFYVPDNALAPHLLTLVGGSADLGPSNNTDIKQGGDFEADTYAGRTVHFGVREHAMGATLTGMSLNGGLIPFGGTFMCFSDYMKPAIRLAALSHVQVVYVFTHDSIGLGEDGPTHQPVEQLAGLRAIPNLYVIRPADPHEVREAWRLAILRRHAPTALVLTRQKVPTLDRSKYASAEGTRRGAYIIAEATFNGPRPADSSPSPDTNDAATDTRVDETTTPRLVILATGSEVSLALEAREQLQKEGTPTRVISMPCWELFEEQDRSYRDSVIPPDTFARLAVEAASPLGWDRYTGEHGDCVCLSRFGASAPGANALKNLGFNVENVVARARALLKS